MIAIATIQAQPWDPKAAKVKNWQSWDTPDHPAVAWTLLLKHQYTVYLTSQSTKSSAS